MSDTLEPSNDAKKTIPTQEKPSGLSEKELALVAERLSLILGHLSKMPPKVVSGARVFDGFLLVAIKIDGHSLGVDGQTWTLDGIDVTTWL